MEYAGFWVRVLAKLIDFIMFLPLLCISYILFKDNNYIFLRISLSITVLMLLYNIIFVYLIGRTLGKMVMNLKVVKTDGGKVGIVNSISREVFAIISLLLWIILSFGMFGGFLNSIYTFFSFAGYFEAIVCLFNYRYKTVHDFIGNTVVIRSN